MQIARLVYIKICILETLRGTEADEQDGSDHRCVKGIGLAVAEVFAAEGCHLHLAARNGRGHD